MAQTAAQKWGKTYLESFNFGRQNIRYPPCCGILAKSFRMENGRETLYKPEELLFRGLVERYADSGFTRRRGRKKQISDGTNPNLEPFSLLGRKGTRGLVLTQRPHLELGEARYPRVLDAIKGKLKGAEGNLRGVPVII